jgi:hypothetical protein
MREGHLRSIRRCFAQQAQPPRLFLSRRLPSPHQTQAWRCYPISRRNGLVRARVVVCETLVGAGSVGHVRKQRGSVAGGSTFTSCLISTPAISLSAQPSPPGLQFPARSRFSNALWRECSSYRGRRQIICLHAMARTSGRQDNMHCWR